MGLNCISNFHSAPANAAWIRSRFCAGSGGHDRSGKPRSPDRYSGLDKGLQVVIIEDELGAAWLLEGLLENLGHHVLRIFATAEEALTIGLENADLALIDINLGTGVDGITVAQQLASRSSAQVIFCSAYSDEATRQRVLECVPRASLVTKPVSEHELSAAISAAVRITE